MVSTEEKKACEQSPDCTSTERWNNGNKMHQSTREIHSFIMHSVIEEIEEGKAQAFLIFFLFLLNTLNL